MNWSASHSYRRRVVVGVIAAGLLLGLWVNWPRPASRQSTDASPREAEHPAVAGSPAALPNTAVPQAVHDSPSRVPGAPLARDGQVAPKVRKVARPAEGLLAHPDRQPEAWGVDNLARWPTLDVGALYQEDAQAANRVGVPMRIGVNRPWPGGILRLQNGRWTLDLSGRYLWTYQLEAPGAAALRVHFSDFQAPADAKLTVMGTESESVEVYGGGGPQGTGTFWTAPIHGNRVFLEYRSPVGDPTPPFIEIDQISHIYRNPPSAGQAVASEGVASGGEPQPQTLPCQVDVNCTNVSGVVVPPAVRDAVAGLAFNTSSAEFFCTGTLLSDADPNTYAGYLLTANHCLDSQAEANPLAVYWFYQTAACGGAAPPALSNVTRSVGATLLATSANSDFTLLRLHDDPNGGQGFVEWTTNSPSAGEDLVSIHHPGSDPKRISVGELISHIPACGSFPGSRFWYLDWFLGVTEGGSSGGPLFDSNWRLIGQLFGLCVTGGSPGCSNPQDYDVMFGRFNATYPLISTHLQSVAPDDQYEDNDTLAQAQAIAPGTNALRLVDFDDYFSLSLSATGSITATAAFNTGNLDLDLELLNESGTVIISSAGSTGTETLTTNVPPGTYFIRAAKAHRWGGDYALTVAVEPASAFGVTTNQPQISWSSPADIVYGTALSALQLNATATFDSTNVPGTFTYTPAAGAILSAGAAQQLEVTFTPDDTTNWVAVTTNVLINVLPKPLTITANSTSKTYGQTVTFAGTEFTTGAGQLINGNTVTSVTLNSAGAAGSATVTAPGPNYAIVASAAAGNGLGNYNISYVNGSLTITAKPLTLAGLTANSKVYDGNASASISSYGTLSGIVGADSVTLNTSGASASFANATVANGKTVTVSGLSLNGSAAGNYSIANQVTTANITGKPLTLTGLTANSKVYDGNASASISSYGTLSGIVGADNVTLNTSGASASFANAAVANGKTVTVGGLSLNGSAAANYSIGNQTTTANITAKPLTITASNRSKTYGQMVTFDGTTPSTDFSVSGLVNSDTVTNVTLTSGGAVATAPVAGSPYPIIPSAAVGTGLANYSISYQTGNLTVNAAVLIATADDKIRSYGTTNPVFTITYSGFANGDTAANIDVPPVASTLADTNSEVGEYAITLSGGSDDNYIFDLVEGTLRIGNAVLTITPDNKSKVYGDADPSYSVSYQGFLNDDDESTLTGTLVFTRDPGEGVGDYSIIASGLSSTNYTVVYVEGTLSVTPATLTIRANNRSKTYGQTVSFAGTEFTTGAGQLVNGDTVTGVTLSSAGAAGSATVTAPGPNYAITPSAAAGSGLGNYNISYVNGTLTVNAKPLTITANNRSKTYGQTMSFAGTEFTTGVGQLVNGDTVTSVTLSSGGAVATATVTGGPYTIIPSAAMGTGLANYSIGYQTGNLTVNAAVLTATADDKIRAYGTTNPVFTISYSGFANLDTAANIDVPPVASTLADTNSEVGEYAITLSGGSDDNYVFDRVDGTLTVAMAVLTITPDNKSKVYGDADPSYTVSYQGFLNNDDESTLTGTLVFTRDPGEVVGDYDIIASGLTSTNYTVVYVEGTLSVTPATLTITANNRSKTYGQTVSFAGTEFTTGAGQLINGDTVTNVTLNSAGAAGSATVTPPGPNYAITPSAAAGSGLGNYNISYVNGSLTITAKPLTITANNRSKTYGQTVSFVGTEFTTGAGQLINGDTVTNVTLNSAGAAGSATVTPPGPNYAITPSAAAGSGMGNYNISYVNGSLTITAKPLTLAGLTANSKIYDGNASANISSYGTLSGIVGADSVTLNTSGASASFANATVANGKTVTVSGLSLNGSAAGNYSIANQVTTANITGKPLTLTGLTANSKVYDGNASASISSYGTLSGIVGADSVTLNTSGASASFANAAVANGKPVTVSGLSLNGSAAGNYSIANQTTSANITPASVTIASGISVNNRGYDGTTVATLSSNNVVLSGVLAGDNASVFLSTNGYTATFASSDVGTSIAVTVSGLSLTGSASANYSLLQPTGLTGNITAAAAVMIVSGLTANNRVYDGSTVATLSSNNVVLSGVLAEDAANVFLSTNGYTANFAAAGAGAGKSVTVSGLSLTGSASTNYTLTQPANLTADITPLGITGNFTAANKTYDGNTTATVLTRSLDGVLPGDVGNVFLTNGTAAFATASAATGKTVTLTGATLTGFAASNYSLNSVSTTAANITPLGITGNFTAANKTYDGNTTASVLTRSLNGVLAGDAGNVTLTGGTASFATASAVTGKTVTLSGATLIGSAAGNYSLTLMGTTTANITPLGITGNVTAANKTYDGNTSATVLTRSLNGVLAGDISNVTLTGGTASFATATAATGKTVTLTGATLAGSAAANYSLTSAGATTADITPLGINGNFTAANKTYDGNTTATVLTRSLTGVLASDAGNVTLTGGTATFATASTATGKTVTLTGAMLTGSAAGNYSLSSVATTTANITPAALTITADDKTKLYGAALPTFTATYNGFVNGETPAVLDTPVTFNTTATASSDMGDYDITVSGAADANYNISFVNGVLTVIPAGPAPLTITADNKTKVYGAPLPALTATYQGFINGEGPEDLDTPPTLSTTATTNSNAGTYPILVSGAADTNYSIFHSNGVLTITPAVTLGTLISSANPQLPGRTLAYTFRTTVQAPGAGTPNGPVRFFVNGIFQGQLDLAGGEANVFFFGGHPVGTHTITAEYAGSTNFLGVTNTLFQLVNTPPVAGADGIGRRRTSATKVAVATLLANDRNAQGKDADGDPVSFHSLDSVSAAGGTLSVSGGWVFYVPPPGYTNGDSFTYRISDGRGGPVSGTVTVTIVEDNVPSPNLVIDPLGDGSYRLRFNGVPGFTYRIEYTESLASPNWQPLSNGTANQFGVFVLLDAPPAGSPGRFYRSVYP